MRVHAALLAVALLFTANYVIAKLGMREMSPLTFAWLRVAGSAVILWFLARRDPLPREERRLVLLFAILAVVINQTMFLSGLAFTTVQVAAILITSIPVFALGLAITLGRERASAMRIGGIALACAGALLVVGGEGLSGSARSLIGAAMLLINCFGYALYLVLSKPHMARLSPKAVVAQMFVMGTVLMLPICALPMWRENWSGITSKGWIALGAVILGPTVAAYLLQAWALRHADSSSVAAYTYVQPVLATLLGAMIFGERVRGIVVVAAVMIFLGVWLAGRSTGTMEASV